MAYTMLEQVKEGLGHLFNLEPLNEHCLECKAQIHKAAYMPDEGCEAGAWIDYRFCNCPEVLIKRDEIKNRVTPLRVPIEKEFYYVYRKVA